MPSNSAQIELEPLEFNYTFLNKNENKDDCRETSNALTVSGRKSENMTQRLILLFKIKHFQAELRVPFKTSNFRTVPAGSFTRTTAGPRPGTGSSSGGPRTTSSSWQKRPWIGIWPEIGSDTGFR